jgi:deoxyribodipyrimidine photo-lyase
MWFASIWIFTLRLPWQLGAALFMRELLDADPASNTLSWRWVAGLHTRGKHYVARADNIARFTEGRFDPRGQLNESALPISETAELPRAQPLPQLPQADPSQRSVWLLHSEDLSITSLPLPADIRPVACAAWAAAAPLDQAMAACEFTRSLLHDAAQAMEVGQGTACPVLCDMEALLQWAQRSGAQQVLTAFAAIGPVADELAVLDSRLAERGIALVRVMRDWDQCFWPHATRGYFQLRAQIPQHLPQLLGA